MEEPARHQSLPLVQRFHKRRSKIYNKKNKRYTILKGLERWLQTLISVDAHSFAFRWHKQILQILQRYTLPFVLPKTARGQCLMSAKAARLEAGLTTMTAGDAGREIVRIETYGYACISYAKFAIYRATARADRGCFARTVKSQMWQAVDPVRESDLQTKGE